MRITVGNRLFFLSSVAAVVAAAIGGSGIKGMLAARSALEDVVVCAQGQGNFMQSDMMHDAIRADVLRAMLAEDENEFNESKKELSEHVASFRESMEANTKLPLAPEILKALAEVDAPLNAYFASAESLFNTAHTDKAAAKAMFPKFQEVFTELEGRNETVGNLFEKAAVETKTAASDKIATAKLVLFLSAGLGLAALAGFAFVVTRSIVRPLHQVVGVMSQMAQGDLRERLDESARDELGDMARAANTMAASMSAVISQVQASSEDVAAAATQISASADEMSSTMNQQMQQVDSIAHAMEEMNNASRDVAAQAGTASKSAENSGAAAQQGGEVVRHTVQAMQEINHTVSEAVNAVSALGKRGEEIGQIVRVINDIAEQTNLLALNAAIEAARAGEHGRGFAVVADEVRKLADRTTKATAEIGQSIGLIRGDTTTAVEQIEAGKSKVNEGVERATEAGASIEAIVRGSTEVSGLVARIAAAGQQQASVAEDVTKSVATVSSGIRETTSAVQQAAQAAGQLSEKAEHLKSLVTKFRV
ncbi:MAG: methyl-accepting chemotaxis protein [Phycisphaerales bacterium]|nr:methyl-accepting chemotaxis protein [Phycisphaerales bacterium]